MARELFNGIKSTIDSNGIATKPFCASSSFSHSQRVHRCRDLSHRANIHRALRRCPPRPPLSCLQGELQKPGAARKNLRRHTSACSVVTFESYTDNYTLDRPGFGEVFLDANSVDAIHIIPRNNDRCQYSEIDEACRRVRALTASFPHVVAYGQSMGMGGYGALRLGGRMSFFRRSGRCPV